MTLSPTPPRFHRSPKHAPDFPPDHPRSDRPCSSRAGLARRHHPRLSVQRAAKVLCNQSQRFLAAVTEDLSVGGARVRVESQRPFAIGDSVKVGIAWSQSGIIRTDQLIEAKVVRVDPVLALADAAGATSSPISGPAIRLGLAFAHAASSATPAKAAA